MTLAKPAFPTPDHDHGRCTADALAHAETVCEARAQKFTPIRRQVLGALLSSHRPLGAYEIIDELAKSMPRPAPITVYRALDFLMANGLVHRIESGNAYLACAAHDHDVAVVRIDEGIDVVDVGPGILVHARRVTVIRRPPRKGEREHGHDRDDANDSG